MTRMFSLRSLSRSVWGVGLGLALALIVDRPLPAADPLTVEQSLAAFQTASDLVVELVASAPAVVDPVAAVFAKDGSLWVV